MSESKTISCVIIEDEEGTRETFELLLEMYCPEIQVVGHGASVAEGIEAINSNRPDLVFLDIELPDGSGFDVVQSMDERQYDVIFTTAYNQYALKAFQVAALDYLLKPISPDLLQKAVDKFKKTRKSTFPDSLEVLKNYLNGQKKVEKIALPTTDGLDIINAGDILYIQGSRNYTEFHTIDQKYVVSRTLKEYENVFDDNEFCRIHKSHIINLRHLKKYIKGRGGIVVLADGTNLEVSRMRKDDLMQALDAMG